MQTDSALLVLEDGTAFPGSPLGARGEAGGEVVFTTSMTGYQEIITDPSYCGQLVCLTVPHVGNVGVNPDDLESTQPWLAGFIVREVPEEPSNWRSTQDLDSWLKDHKVVGITRIDTRKLVRHIRERGAMRGIVSSSDLDPVSLQAKMAQVPQMEGLDLVERVTCHEVEPWTDGLPNQEAPAPEYRVVAYDFGVKHNILRLLKASGLEVLRVPARTSADEVLAMQPDGVFLSNGPGDPAAVDYAVAEVRKLLGKVPLFGICLGHQILGLALGARTYKLKFGHRGANQPVRRLETGQVEITTQNHGFAVTLDTLPPEVEVTHLNLNDGTVEGLRHKTLPAFSVQYHPEASPGPHDSKYLFDEFKRLIHAEKNRSA
ncbi:MAG: glutamine-hydrolyzing carbamoyl-phosphate synthase small subunit [Vulcanimicrobiota bacterium]